MGCCAFVCVAMIRVSVRIFQSNALIVSFVKDSIMHEQMSRQELSYICTGSLTSNDRHLSLVSAIVFHGSCLPSGKISTVFLLVSYNSSS